MKPSRHTRDLRGLTDEEKRLHRNARNRASHARRMQLPANCLLLKIRRLFEHLDRKEHQRKNA